MSVERQLPEGWRWVKFGDVARQLKEDVDPESGELERYVAGEHMQTDDLRIRSWGTVGDGYLGPAFHRRFRNGQILYGSRRTYLRKVAVADFDGICANTTFVIEAKPDIIDPDLLPFIMQSDGFNEYSVRNSKGSVNPYVNWGDIASYEFPLPPLDEQHRIAEILWAVEEAVELQQVVLDSFEDLERVLFSSFLHNGLQRQAANHRDTKIGTIPAHWQYKSCGELFVEEPRNGLSPQVNPYGLGYPTISISAVRDGIIDFENNLKFAEVEEGDATQFRIYRDDVLVVRGNGNKMLVGRCGVVVSSPPEGCFYPDLLIRVRFDSTQIRPQFAAILWNFETFHLQLRRRAKSSNGIWKVNGDDLRKHKLIVPSLDEQDEFLSRIDTLQESKMRSQTNIRRLKALKVHLVSQFLDSEQAVLNVQ